MIDKWINILSKTNNSIVNNIKLCNSETIFIVIPRFLHPNLIDKYFSDILNTNNINHIKIIRNNMDIILKYYVNLQNFLIRYISVTNDYSIIIDYFDDIVKNCNDYSFSLLIKNMIGKYKNIDDMLKNKYPFMFNLIDNIKDNLIYSNILNRFVTPIITNNKENEFNYIFELLKNNGLDINSLKFINQSVGDFNFRLENYKLILSTYKNNFEIYNHYRINESLVRKKITLNNYDNIYIEVNPIEENEEISDRDIYDALDDLYNDGIIVTNSNYDKIFALVNNTIPQNFKRDVSGIIENRQNNYSESYMKKKVKLIRKDYIYDRNCHTFNKVEKIN